jgi:hypothetical protein
VCQLFYDLRIVFEPKSVQRCQEPLLEFVVPCCQSFKDGDCAHRQHPLRETFQAVMDRATVLVQETVHTSKVQHLLGPSKHGSCCSRPEFHCLLDVGSFDSSSFGEGKMPGKFGGRVGNVARCWGVVLEYTVVLWGRRVVPD